MNGWKNYETWNVSLWIQNDETLYKLALMSAGFQSFVNQLDAWGCYETDDGVKCVSNLEPTNGSPLCHLHERN